MHTLIFPQKPIHNNVESSVLAVDNENSSGETSCNSSLLTTCEQTSVSSLAVWSLISLCLMEGNLPLGQDRA